MKLQQGQIWRRADEFIRIVHLERLKVSYKVVKNIKSGEGTHHHTSKKDFCRLLKSATLVTEQLPVNSLPPPPPEEETP